jgi:hypothetical protein
MNTVWYDKMVTIPNAALRSKFSRSTIDRRVNDGRLSCNYTIVTNPNNYSSRWVTIVDINEVNQIALDRKV